MSYHILALLSQLRVHCFDHCLDGAKVSERYIGAAHRNQNGNYEYPNRQRATECPYTTLRSARSKQNEIAYDRPDGGWQ